MCSSIDSILLLHLLYSPAALRGSFLCCLRKIEVLWRARVKNIISSALFRVFSVMMSICHQTPSGCGLYAPTLTVRGGGESEGLATPGPQPDSGLSSRKVQAFPFPLL